MSASPVVGRRLRPFRLDEVPEKLRQRAADNLIRSTDGFDERLLTNIAAHRPSDRGYVVSLVAWERVMGP